MPFLLKLFLSVAIILIVTEVTKRFGVWGALIASLPLISILAMVWIYVDTGDTAKIAEFSLQVFWFVLPSLGLFLSLPWLLQRMPFYPALGVASLIAMALFAVMLWVLRLFNYRLL